MKGQGRGGLCRTALRDLNAAAEMHRGKHFSSFTSSPASYHDDVVLGEAVWQLCHVTPVGRLLAGDNDTGGRNLHGLHVAGQLGDGDVGLQQLHPLQPPVDGRDVDGLQGADGLLQDPIDEVHGAVLKQEQSLEVVLRVGYQKM